MLHYTHVYIDIDRYVEDALSRVHVRRKTQGHPMKIKSPTMLVLVVLLHFIGCSARDVSFS